jgi:hypothetical protein
VAEGNDGSGAVVFLDHDDRPRGWEHHWFYNSSGHVPLTTGALRPEVAFTVSSAKRTFIER